LAVLQQLESLHQVSVQASHLRLLIVCHSDFL
jgi:hypothetical protein